MILLHHKLTSFDSELKVDVDAKSVIGNTWHLWESTCSQRKADIAAVSFTGGSSGVGTAATRNKSIVPVWIPIEI